MELEGGEDRTMSRSVIEDNTESLAQKNTKAGVVQRDPAAVKALWDEWRAKLWIDDDEIYATEGTAAHELQIASGESPFSNCPFSDGERLSSVLCRVGDLPLMVVAAEPKDNDTDSMSEYDHDSEDDSKSEFNLEWNSGINADWMAEYKVDWTSYDDCAHHVSDDDLMSEKQHSYNPAAPIANQMTTTLRGVNEQQHHRPDQQGAGLTETSQTETDLDKEKAPTRARLQAVTEVPPTEQVGSAYGKRVSSSINERLTSGMRGSKKTAWRKIKGMLGVFRPTTQQSTSPRR